MSDIIPHPYQLDYAQGIDDGWKAGFKKQVVISPTGSGKTSMFLWEVQKAHNRGERSLILVDQNELVTQPINRLRIQCGIHADAERAEWKAPKSSMVVVATVQSMVRRLDNWDPNHFALIIADEADKSITASWLKVLNHFDANARVIGWTATPNRTDAKNLGVYYENKIEKENLWTLINKGFLSPITIKSIPVKFDLSSISSRGGDYDENELDELIGPHLEKLARQWLVNAWDRQGLAFLPLIKTCQTFTGIAKDIGLNAEWISGDDPEREAKLNRFKAGEIDVMANAMLLTRGVDVPQVSAIGMWRPTKSITLYFQAVGRGTRIFPGKENCLLLDPLYQAMKRLICRPAHLITKIEEEAESITKLIEERSLMPGDVASQLDLLKIAGEASSQREAALKKKLEEHKNKQAKTISAEEFARRYHAIQTAEFEPVMAWEKKELSPKQIKYLGDAGIDIATVEGNAHANQLLDIYFKNKSLRLASHSVRALMKRMGRPNWATATEAEGKQFFVQLNAKKQKKAAMMI